jgi:hypothetical protein
VFVRIKKIGDYEYLCQSFGQFSGIAIVFPRCYVVGTTILDICDPLAHTFNYDNGFPLLGCTPIKAAHCQNSSALRFLLSIVLGKKHISL